MNRTKYLLKNTAILFISNFASKLLVFFLLPLYTSVLSTAEYGISDLITTTVNILYIFLTLYISNGIIRYTMNGEADKNEMFSVGIAVVLISTVIVALGSALASGFNLFPNMTPYYGYLVFIFSASCLSSMLNAYAKGNERIRLIGVSGIAATAARILFNILLLVVIKLNIRGYLMSAAFSYVAGCSVYVFGGLLKNVRIKLPSKSNVKKLIKYSAPIAATEVGWLICTSSDKYIVSWLLGDSATGIISAAHRLPTILTAFTSVFIQAWSLSAIKEYANKDKSQYYTKMFNYYNSFAIVAGAILILLSRLIGAFLFRGDFSVAWIYTPIYLTALVINTMSSFSGSIISAGTDTKPLFTSTMAGAVLNIILDIVLIKYLGIFGAGIATAISYFVIGTMRMRTVNKEFDIQIEMKRMSISVILLVALTATMIFSDNTICLVASIVLCLGIIVINANRIKDIISMLMGLAHNFLKKA